MKFRQILLALIALSACFDSLAQGVRKCVDADGNITFVQGDCPQSEAQEEVKIHGENRGVYGSRRYPKPVDGLEWVWIESVSERASGGIIVRENGDSYDFQQVEGCAALGQYGESFAQVFSAGEFGYGQLMLVLPEHQQRCLLLYASRDSAPEVQAAAPEAKPTAPVAAIEQPRSASQPSQYARRPASDASCRNLRRRHNELSRPCRGLDACEQKRASIEDLRRKWQAGRCEGALGIGAY